MCLHMPGFRSDVLSNFGKFVADLQGALGGLRTCLLQLQSLHFQRMNASLHTDNRAALLRRQYARFLIFFVGSRKSRFRFACCALRLAQ